MPLIKPVATYTRDMLLGDTLVPAVAQQDLLDYVIDRSSIEVVEFSDTLNTADAWKAFVDGCNNHEFSIVYGFDDFRSSLTTDFKRDVSKPRTVHEFLLPSFLRSDGVMMVELTNMWRVPMDEVKPLADELGIACELQRDFCFSPIDALRMRKLYYMNGRCGYFERDEYLDSLAKSLNSAHMLFDTEGDDYFSVLVTRIKNREVSDLYITSFDNIAKDKADMLKFICPQFSCTVHELVGGIHD